MAAAVVCGLGWHRRSRRRMPDARLVLGSGTAGWGSANCSLRLTVAVAIGAGDGERRRLVLGSVGHPTPFGNAGVFNPNGFFNQALAFGDAFASTDSDAAPARATWHGDGQVKSGCCRRWNIQCGNRFAGRKTAEATWLAWVTSRPHFFRRTPRRRMEREQGHRRGEDAITHAYQGT